MTLKSFSLILFLTTNPLFGQDALPIPDPGSAAPKFWARYVDSCHVPLSAMSKCGAEFYSSDFYGVPRNNLGARKERNPVVLSFFASWCLPCRKEIPELEKLQALFPAIKFLLVNVGEDLETIGQFLADFPVTLPILQDVYGKLAEKYQVKAPGVASAVLPTLVVVNRKGQIKYYKRGYKHGDEKLLEQELQTLIR